MNKDNAPEYLPLVQALAEGKTIQGKISATRWADDESPDFQSYPPEFYRVKPEPEELWLVFFPDGKYTDHSSLELAKKVSESRVVDTKIFHCTEVLDDE